MSLPVKINLLKTRLRDDLKRNDFQLRKINEQIEKISTEITGYQNYLDRIKKNKYKNKQLKKIQELSAGLNIGICPVCESDLRDSEDDSCHLCHTPKKRSFSTPDQNLIFLEDEEKTFKKVISQRILDRKKIFEQRDQIKDKISQFEKQLDHQTATYAGEEFAKLRERILQVDTSFKEKEKYKRIAERWDALNPLRKERDKLKKQLDDLKTQISSYTQTENDIKILKNIQANFRKNVKELGLFKANQRLISDIKIDAVDNYTPYLDNFDIYNISSSSDNIRIILSYYLSLLQTSIELKSNAKIKFPNLLILDEPKQQNLDNASLINCIELIEKIPMNISQVILTTYSELESDRERLKKYINYEMKSSTDYLLKKTKK
jgi:DNA repair exonuclease SbcCD ATPase subunit